MTRILIRGEQVNLRAGPGLEYNIIKSVYKDEVFDWLWTYNDRKDKNFQWHGSAQGWTRSDLSVLVGEGTSGGIGGAGGGAGTPVAPITKLPRPCNAAVWEDYHPPSHLGIDLSGAPVPIANPNGGTVYKTFLCTACGTDPEHQSAVGDFSAARGYGFGNYVIVKWKQFYILYGHLQAIYVRPGEELGTWGSLGLMGKSGNATGYHLHLEVRTTPDFDGTIKNLVDPKAIFNL